MLFPVELDWIFSVTTINRFTKSNHRFYIKWYNTNLDFWDLMTWVWFDPVLAGLVLYRRDQAILSV